MSIYRRICAAITDNTLPKDFYIDSNAPSKKIRFAPGAMDGIMMYSMGVSQKECPDDLIREIIAASPENTYNTEAVERALDGQYMLSIIDDLQGKIKGNADMKNTFMLGMQLITESDSRGFQLVQHEPFTSITKAVEEGQDIKSTVEMVEMANHRMMVKDTDKGAELQAQINDLKELLLAYRNGDIKERDWHPITNKM